MRNFGQWRASILLASLLACAAAPDAGAQSLFQSIFGNLFKSAPPKPAPAPSVTTSPKRQESNFPGAYDVRPQLQTEQSYYGGAYRTVCVRTCDGYYFPISSSASRGKFHKDAEACSARCGGGKLYYLPRNSEDMAGMVDLTGRRYDQLDRAFIYRKKLIDGCACRPMPWTAGERARHNRYAYAEQINLLNAERAKQRQEQAIARANEPPIVNAADPGVPAELAEGDTPNEIAEGGSSDKIAEAAPAEIETPPDAAGGAFLTAVKTAIADEAVPGAEATLGQDATAQTVSYSPRNAATARTDPNARPRRVRKTKRKSSSANGWPFSGAGKYTWPGDR